MVSAGHPCADLHSVRLNQGRSAGERERERERERGGGTHPMNSGHMTLSSTRNSLCAAYRLDNNNHTPTMTVVYVMEALWNTELNSI